MAIKELLSRIIKKENGQALVPVLALLALGSLVMAPSLDFLSTNLKATAQVKQRTKALYTADAGAEHGIWTLKKSEPATVPYSYNLVNINGLSVNVVIDKLDTIAGQSIEESGVHGGWMKITKTVTYSAGVYEYTLNVENNGAGNMKVDKILIDLPANVDYIDETTTGMTSDPPPPLKVGTPDTGITLVWEFPEYTLSPHENKDHHFHLSGPAGVEGVAGHSFVRATREDVGVVWDGDSKPYSIVAQARNSAGTAIATMKVGIWRGTAGSVQIACWQVNP